SPPPPGSYEYNTPGGRRHHRHDSHSYFTSSDPYRAVRKSTTPESEAFHSRTESDSSTSRLAPNLPPSSKNKKSSNNNKHYHSNKQQRHGSYYDPYDPYAVPARNQQQYPMLSTGEKSFQSEEQRANSYLPYSHHDRGDPFATPDPVYIEEENLPSFVSPSKGGVGSLLQDNIALDSVSEQQRSFQQQHHHQNLAAIGEGNNGELPEIKRRKKKRRCCGLHRRTVVFVVFVFVILVAVAWYFVWPRWANGIEYRGASWPDGYDLVAQDNVIKAVWNVSFTVDNSKNWVPTHVKNYEVKVQDMSTGKQIGEGSTGSMVLSRDSFIPIDVILNIDYSASDPNDATLQSLGSSCTAHAENPGPVVTINGTQSSSLNLAFQITQRITGLVGSAASTVRPSSFQCPIPS
ncbi:hypothetical protein INT45_003869, partial [Circinella minor]